MTIGVGFFNSRKPKKRANKRQYKRVRLAQEGKVGKRKKKNQGAK